MISFGNLDLGVVKVVKDYQLLEFSSQGWTILGMYQETEMEEIEYEVAHYPTKEDSHNSYGSTPTRKKKEFQPRTTTRFILAQSKDETIRDITHRMELAESGRAAALKAGEENSKKVATLELAAATAATTASDKIARLELDVKLFNDSAENSRTVINARNLEISQLKTEISALEKSDVTISRLHALEDWVIRASEKIDLKSFDLSPPPVAVSKTWAERLMEED